jgi:hypothetical protein
VSFRVNFPQPTFAAQQVGDQEFQRMFMEGTGESGDVGDPGPPVLSSFFAVPTGADVSVTVNDTKGYDLRGVELFPVQKEPVDGKPSGIPALEQIEGLPPVSTFMPGPFEIDKKAYDSKALFPAAPSDAALLGGIRDLRVGGVDFAGGQYKPKTEKLHVYTSIDVTVNFGGDNSGTFAEATDINNPWEARFASNYAAILENYATVADHLRPGTKRPFCGEEMLVVTSPDLQPAANTFADARRAAGISASVVTTGTGPGQIGTTNTQIQSFILDRLNDPACLIHPSYVVLFGNTAHVPTFLAPCSPGGDPGACNIASDLPYTLNGPDLFADVMLGRIPAASLPAAEAVVTKIVNYETTPPAPSGDDFYSHATTTSYFQPPLVCVLNEGASGTPNCNPDSPPVTGHWEIDYPANTDTRGFTITSERVNVAMRNNGYNVDRLYTTDDEDVIPQNYWNGTPIPAHLRRPTFAWDANTTDFFNAYNEGRFMILHRDHGWPDGFAEPTLHSGHVPFFTNGTKLPVVFGINCASMAFDTPSHPSFVELQVMKPDGGAFAGFGDTRNSPSFPNNHMALGFMDAFFPNVAPEFGSDVPTRRLGDVLVRGKQYMAAQEGTEWHGAGDTYVEHFLYGLLGDPSAQMWAAEPVVWRPPELHFEFERIFEPRPGDPFFKVNIRLPIGGPDPPPFGTIATLLHDGEAIGRAVVGADGTATITPDAQTNADDLTVALDQTGALPVQKEVEGVPTSLTITGPSSVNLTGGSENRTFSGHLDPPAANAPIRVVYTSETGSPNAFPPITHNTTTNANGDWSDDWTFPQGFFDFGTWRAQAFFDGGDGYQPSSSPVHRFNVGD